MVKSTWRGPWHQFKFLKVNFQLRPLADLQMLRTAPRGVGKRKKKDIQTNLLPLFARFPDGEEAKEFWNNLPTSTHSPGLAMTDDEDPSFVEKDSISVLGKDRLEHVARMQ